MEDAEELYELYNLACRVDAVNQVPCVSEKGVNYSKLKQLLAVGDWKKAEMMTFVLMIRAADRTEEGWLRKEDLLQFPCADLKIIDQLWFNTSGGRCGFSVQKEIYEKCGAKLDGNYPGHEMWKKFGNEVGWRINDFMWLKEDSEAWGNLNWFGRSPSHIPGLLWNFRQLTSFNDMLGGPWDLFFRMEACGIDTTSFGERAKAEEKIYNHSPRTSVQAESQSDSCFVATVVFGNSYEPEVVKYRNFRDKHLSKSIVGRRFIEFYYSWLGLLLSNYIGNNLLLKKICFLTLRSIAKILPSDC